MADSLQMDEFLIEGFGTVTGPPDLETILQKVSAAAAGKLALELAPAEARVLGDFIDGMGGF